ncbi:efflux RND transporter periplasmic adaptor subunit [Chitinophaga sp. sic0106]|uniref:efflux RND transporter periplasmic adaptor subunit n=1 Tax=Chitinophaga sp. sic0106 TaxID=2854785 RepID=UPI001C4837B1|nr:efflux RND transporter periplasmic adaptor subunit [Chitinophaga sp. sic0106]MBV7529505.1 efflux RND transporter periplasmic adaptor subunit [Chitinophaga sp. sic0106]
MYLNKYSNILLFSSAVILSACGGGKKNQQAAMMGQMKATVVPYVVQAGSYTVSEKFPATLTANNIVEIRADVTGFLDAIKVPDGADVQKGEVLYEIERSRYTAALDQSAATRQQAEADLAQKERDYERYKNLLEHDAISKQTVDQAYTAMLTAKANLAAAQAAVARAGTDVNHSLIKAPVSGKIGIVLIKVGDIVNAGQTLINTVVNEQPMFVDFDVSQSRVQEFTKLKVNPGDIKFHLQFTNGERYNETGELITINNTVDQATGTVKVRLQFANKDRLLTSGMSLVVIMEYNTAPTQVAIPAKAIIQNLSETSVMLINKDNVIQQKGIDPGPQADTMLLIRSGLNVGDRIVVDGLQKVRPGDTVNIAGATPPPAATKAPAGK